MSDFHPAFAADNVAVVTGAASGIGLAASRRFAAMSLKVCLADRDEARLTEPAASIEGTKLAVPVDVSDCVSVEA